METSDEAMAPRLFEVVGTLQAKSASPDERMDRTERASKAMSSFGPDRIAAFVEEVVASCPYFGEKEAFHLQRLLMKLEHSTSRFGLLEVLDRCESSDYDKLHHLLSRWSASSAKLVLDEIEQRLALINELRQRVAKVGVDELHELQPLFERGLWMFGVQLESVEFTSNLGMSRVLRQLFKDSTGKGSRNRPDFIALPNSSVGLYAKPSWDKEHEVNGVGQVVVVELKTTDVAIGGKDVDQAWTNIKELMARGYVRVGTRVDAYVLGNEIEPCEAMVAKRGDSISIVPMLYETLLTRAETRMLGLHRHLRHAPFMLAA